VWAGFDSEFDEVAAEQDRLRCVILNGERGRALKQPFAFRKVVRRNWRPAIFVGMRHAGESIDAFDTGGEAADSGVARAVAVESERAHVLFDQREDFFEDFLLAGESFEKGFRHGHALDIVAGASDSTILIGVAGAGFTEVVAEHGEADDEILPFLADAVGGVGIETVSGMGPDIAFGVPLRVLSATHERFQFGEILEPAGCLKEVQTGGNGSALKDEFFPFFPKALTGQLSWAELTAEADRFGICIQVETGDKLHAPEHAERVFGEGAGDMSEAVVFEVFEASKGVNQVACERVATDGVDREVAACSGLFGRHSGVAFDLEIGVSGAGFGLTPGEGDINIFALDYEYAEGAPDGIQSEVWLEGGFDGLDLEAVYFHVDIFGRSVEKCIANAATDEHGATVHAADNFSDFEYSCSSFFGKLLD